VNEKNSSMPFWEGRGRSDAVSYRLKILLSTVSGSNAPRKPAWAGTASSEIAMARARAAMEVTIRMASSP